MRSFDFHHENKVYLTMSFLFLNKRMFNYSEEFSCRRVITQFFFYFPTKGCPC